MSGQPMATIARPAAGPPCGYGRFGHADADRLHHKMRPNMSGKPRTKLLARARRTPCKAPARVGCWRRWASTGRPSQGRSSGFGPRSETGAPRMSREEAPSLAHAARRARSGAGATCHVSESTYAQSRVMRGPATDSAAGGGVPTAVSRLVGADNPPGVGR